jgi:peptidoglycan hydrolase-like protein with peptidoglycan-binding domain
VPKRSGRSVAIDEDNEQGGWSALLLRYPRECVGIVMATAAVATIFVNALFLQKGPHPAPIFSTRPLLAPQPVIQARPIARPAVQPVADAAAGAGAGPVAAPLNIVELTAGIQRELTRRGFYDGAADGIWGARTDAGVRDFAQAAGLRITPEPTPELLRALQTRSVIASRAAAAAPANDPIAALIAPSQRVLAIQRALSDFGYGQIKPTGTYDPTTRTAIEKFERDRKLPITGQISDRFVRELAAMTGRPLE